MTSCGDRIRMRGLQVSRVSLLPILLKWGGGIERSEDDGGVTYRRKVTPPSRTSCFALCRATSPLQRNGEESHNCISPKIHVLNATIGACLARSAGQAR